VIVSLHWGIHFTEAELAGYQTEVGHAAIDAGADAVLGHHAHILKPIEIYHGKPIFYSLGNFAFDLPYSQDILNSKRFRELMALNPSWHIDPKYPRYPFPADSRKTIVAKILFSGRQITRVSFLPAIVNEDSQPRFVHREDNEFCEIIDYMTRICRRERLETEFVIKGEEVVVVA
jgi:poly-gamma-glutamate synthesis protein (capsule biosynthesis protein)